MNTTIRNTALAALLFATASGAAFAAETANLAVKGEIKPGSCTPSLTGGSIVDFGTFSVTTLSSTAATVLPAKKITLTIDCNNAPTKVGYTISDARPGTEDGVAIQAVAASLGQAGQASYFYGVGSRDGKNIGAYSLKAEDNPTADGKVVVGLRSSDAKNWGAQASNNYMHETMTYSWASTGASAPEAFKTITQSIEVVLGIGKTGDLPEIKEGLPIDGLATISLKYL